MRLLAAVVDRLSARPTVSPTNQDKWLPTKPGRTRVFTAVGVRSETQRIRSAENGTKGAANERQGTRKGALGSTKVHTKCDIRVLP